MTKRRGKNNNKRKKRRSCPFMRVKGVAFGGLFLLSYFVIFVLNKG